MNSPPDFIDPLGEDYMKAFNKWIEGGANERVGTWKQKRMWSREIHRAGLEFILFYQNELLRLENKGYIVECFSSDLMDRLYIENRDYWRSVAAFAALDLPFSQISGYIQELVDEYYAGGAKEGIEKCR